MLTYFIVIKAEGEINLPQPLARNSVNKKYFYP